MKIKNISIAFALSFLCVASSLAQFEGNEAEATPAIAPVGVDVSASLSSQPTGEQPALGDEVETDTTGAMAAGSSGNAGLGSGVLGGFAGSGGGQFNFQTDLSTGRFTYSIPIVVAPGRQGAQPALTLGYNSASGNGWCGVGWNLEVGFIQREVRKGVPIKWAQSSDMPLTQYDDAKGFIANFAGVGSALVLVSATNQNPIIYRQEVETAFLTYKYYNDNHWEVSDKSGNTFYFGEGSTNRMENAKPGWTAGAGSSTFRWALNKVIDVNGNQTILSYAKDGGTLYLTNIAYNANINSPTIAATHTVGFILTNRADTNLTFQSGYRVEMRKRLAEIQVKAAGDNVRKYVLDYINSPSTTRSLLAEVTEYGSDYVTAFPPITFSYQVKPFEFAAETNWSGVSAQGLTDGANNAISAGDGYGNQFLAFKDLDSDGFPDRVMRRYQTPYTNFVVQHNNGSKLKSESSFGPVSSQGETGFWWNSPICGDGSSVNVLLADINGDSRLDRVMRKVLAPYTNFVVQLNTGTGFTAGTNWGPVSAQGITSYDWNSVSAGGVNSYVDMLDMNGDGLPDRVMRKYLSPYTNLVVQLNTGIGFTSEVRWSPLTSQGQADSLWNALTLGDGVGNTALALVDLNGDGLPDRIMRRYSSPYTNFVVQFNNGAGFEAEEIWGPLDGQGQPNSYYWWYSPICGDGSSINVSRPLKNAV